MSLPVYEHTLTVSETTVTPQGPLTCGVSGDERAARLRFCLETADAAAYEYRLETIGGDGAYDLTDRLTPANGELVFDIPSPWTAAGLAAVRLVRSTVADGTETARQYYPPVLLQFAYRDEGAQPMTASPCLQELLARAESVLNKAAETAADAAARADAAQIAAAQAEGFSVQAASEANEARLAAQQAAFNGEAAERAEAAALQAENAVAYCESLVGITAAIKATLGVV